jgi:glycosyltransferase involved in cell wall biosynthesis
MREARAEQEQPDPAAHGRVLLVGNFLSSRGLVARQVCEDLAERLSAAGLSIITTSSKAGRAERLVDMAATAWTRRRDYDVAQVDVFSGPSFVWAEAVCAALRMASKPYVLTLHGGGLPDFFERWPKRGARLLRNAAAVTVPSRFLLEQLRRYRGDLTLLPNAIDVSRYPFRVRDSPTPRLIWIRAFHKLYNPALAPRVVALLKEEFPDIQLTMAGPDKDGSLEFARAEARSLGVESRIDFPGMIPKDGVPSAMAAGDIFLNTTDIDNMPVTLLEAMACGLCVVSTDVGGVPHMINHEANGLLVSRGDGAAMAAAVRRLLCEPGLAGRISAAGRTTAGQCDWSITIPQWQDLLVRVARDGGSPE